MPVVNIVTIASRTSDGDDSTMDDKDYGHMKLRLHSAFDGHSDIRMAGAGAYAENVRYGYLINRDRYSQADSFAFPKASEAGAGRTRVQANTPASTQTVGG